MSITNTQTKYFTSGEIKFSAIRDTFGDLAGTDLRETLVSYLGHSTFFEHVVTYFTEDLKLLFTGESVCVFAVFHYSEKVCFGSNHDEKKIVRGGLASGDTIT